MVKDNNQRIGRRRYIKTVAGATGMVALAGCDGSGDGGGDGTPQTGASEETGTGAGGTTTGDSGGGQTLSRIGFTSYVRGGSWITAYVEAARFYAEDRGIEIDVRPNRQSASKQVSDIRDFADKGFDGIIVGVWSTGAAEGAIDYALDQGVPVMATNADTSSSRIPLYVGFSNSQGGQKSAEEMVAALEEQKPDQDEWRVLNVRGVQGNQSANQRSQGFLDYMDGQDKVTVEQTINGEYAQDVAQNKVQQYVNSNDAPDGIYSGNLSMGLGTVGALRTLDMVVPKGEEGHVVLTQMDGSPQVNPLVADGVIDAAVDQPNYFYNPIAIKYMNMYVGAGGVDGGGQSEIPEVGSTVEEGDFQVEPGDHKDVELWSEPIWSPAEIQEQNGHPWFRTNSIVINQENADQPYLWGNVWGQ